MAEAVQAVRSRNKGLRDIYVAKVIKNTALEYKTETPVKLGRAIKAKVSHKFASETLESDDSTEEIVNDYEGTEVEIEQNTMTPEDKAILFGHTYKDGYLVKNKDDQANEIALGYRSKKINGKYDFVWLYCGKFAEGYDEEFETQKKSGSTYQTKTIKGNFYEREIDGNFEVSVDESNLLEEHTEAKEAITSWFSKVQEPKGSKVTSTETQTTENQG